MTGLSAGTYSVTVTDVFGCSATITATITEPVTPFSIAIQSVGSATVCAGTGVDLTVVGFADPANTYQWNDANGAIAGATSAIYAATTSDTYSLTVTNIDGCIANSDSIVVDIITVTAPIGLFTSGI